MDPQRAEERAATALAAFGRGDFAAVCALSEAAPEQVIARPDLSTLYGMALRRLGRTAECEAAYLQALSVDPSYADACLNLGHLMCEQMRQSEAAHWYRLAIGKRPTWAEPYIALSDTLNQLGQNDLSLHTCAAARHAGIVHADLYNNEAAAHVANGALEAALSACHKALALSWQANAAYNQVLVLERLGRVSEAIEGLQQLCQREAEVARNWIKLGDLLRQHGSADSAANAYEQALLRAPSMFELHNNLGVIRSGQGRWREALVHYQHALSLNGTQAQLYLNLGNTLHALRHFGEAAEAYRAGLALEPEHATLLAELTHVAQKLCDWTTVAMLQTRLMNAALQWTGDGIPPSPFIFLGLPFEIAAADLLTVNRHYARYVSAAAKAPQPLRDAASPRRPGRWRIGYLSADFHNHATAHLMLGLFGRHDRERFEVFAYSLGEDDGSDYRRRIAQDCEHFRDLRTLSDQNAAAQIASDEIDILIDLKGYTGEARPGILARHPGRIQCNYLGYPSTMGASFIDTLIADAIVLPPELAAHCAERVYPLPNCYQVNDQNQRIAAQRPSRSACGLPEAGFVFCCFNSVYKIDASVFACWMRILQATAGSVLWLFSEHAEAIKNLRAAASKAGVDPTRLVFAGKLGKAEHLARHAHADLFLDTLFYNAHTTASDALWAGVPLLSCPGNRFAARVGASLLSALGLSELIVADLPAYEHLAIALAKDHARLSALRQGLAGQRHSAALFDTPRFVRDLEALLLRMAADYSPQESSC